MGKRTVLMIVVAWMWMGTLGMAHADEEAGGFGPPRPGLAIKTGGGLYYSVNCGCADRSLVETELSGRVHFGWRGGLEAGINVGSMLLGGRFPTYGWTAGGRVTILPERGRWWEAITVRAGYRRWTAMGMRANGTHGGYGALNWAVEVLPHLYLEADALVGRTVRVMPHWEFGGRVGVSTRF